MLQMARKMEFSVVGLPHYTIWHLYEPSVDDVKHMEVRSFAPALGESSSLTRPSGNGTGEARQGERREGEG